MTEITAELKALADAALEISGYPTMGTMPWARFDHAVAAYRATQAKECRPPADARYGSRWFLTHPAAAWQVARWMNEDFWEFCGKPCSPEDLKNWGWTCHSECRFGETGVEATDEAIVTWLNAEGFGVINVKLIRDALAHFGPESSGQRISHASILELAMDCVGIARNKYYPHEPFTFTEDQLDSFARMILRHNRASIPRDKA